MALLQRLINYGTSDLQGDTIASNITASKFIKHGSSNDSVLLGGGASSTISLGGGLIGDSTYDSSTGKLCINTSLNNDEFSSIFNPFDTFNKQYTDIYNNLLYRADLRHNVTITNSNNNISASELFNLNYETYLKIDKDETCVIDIKLTSDIVYSYGYVVISFYYDGIPDNVTVQFYAKNNNNTYNWYNIDRYKNTHADTPNKYNINDNILVFKNTDIYFTSEIKITIVGKENASINMYDTALSQIAFYGIRMTLEQSPILSKYLDLNIPYLNIYAKSYKVNNGKATQFLKADGTIDSNTYSLLKHTHYIGTSPVQETAKTQNLTGIDTLTCGNITCTSISETSDIRKKTDIHKLNINLSLLDNIYPYSYFYKDDNLKIPHIGLIAQDIEKYFPEIVHTNKDDGYKSIEYSKIGVLTLGICKNLYDEIKYLKDEIKNLKNKETI